MPTERTVLVRLKGEAGDLVRAATTARAAIAGLTKEIDKTNDRTAWLAQSILALGPTIPALGAAAVPVLAGLTTQLTVAAGAAGVAALAFTGIGDALKSLNTYQLDPSAENFAKLQEELGNLGPAGADFVLFLDQVGGKFQQLQFAAREGMFPGVEEGITSVLDLLPRVRDIVSETAEAMGQLASEAGGGLAGPKFEEFFEFLDRNAKPILLDLGHTVGNLVEGLANLLVAFEPMSVGFSKGLENMSASFASWSRGLDDDSSFQSFLAYVQDATPKVIDLIGSLVDAFVAIVEAAAPVGDVMLPIFTTFFELVAELADSPIGPIFIGAAAAMSLYGRAAALASITTGGLGKSMLDVGRNATSGVGGIRTLTADVGMMRREYERMGPASSVMTSALSQTTGAAQRARSTMVGLGKTAGLVGGLALVTTGVADKMGLANTASLGLMGAMVGGAPGAIAGGLIGAFVDFTSGANHAEDALGDFNDILAQGQTDVSAYAQVVSDAQAKFQEMSGAVPSGFFDTVFSSVTNPETIKLNFAAVTGQLDDTQLAKQGDAARETEQAYGDLVLAINEVGKGFHLIDAGEATQDMGELTSILQVAEPAMDALGITVEDLAQGVRDGSISGLVTQMQAWVQIADSTAGRTGDVADAFVALDDEMLSTKQSAQDLATALDALLGPKLNVSEAVDNWVGSLHSLRSELNKQNKTLVGNSNAALENRNAIRDRVKAMEDMLVAEADAGAGSGKLSRDLRRQRQALLDAGAAAGLSRRELRRYLNDLGLTPELVRTIIDANTEPGDKKRKKVQADLRVMGLMKIHPTIDTNESPAISGINAVRSGLDSLHDKTVTIFTHRVESKEKLAGGGHVRGPGGPTDDLIDAKLSDNEYVVRSAAVDKYGVPFMDQINSMRFADGGHVRASVPASRGSMQVGFDDLRGSVTVSTPWGMQEVEVTARAVARQEIAARDRFQREVIDRD